MQLRVFTGPDRETAMAAMRAALGDDAILVDSREDEGGCRITAARDHGESDLASLLSSQPRAGPQHPAIDWLLAFHRPPQAAASRLRRHPPVTADGDEAVIAELLASLLRFARLPWPQEDAGGASGVRAERPLLLLGLPGSGKTTVAARLALMARQAGRIPEVLSHADQRAGGLEQLKALLAPMQLAARVMDSANLVLADDRPAVIDTLGVNPFSLKEMTALAREIAGMQARPVLVLDGQCAGEDAAEIINNFSAIGVADAIVTRLDLCRRMGTLLAFGGARMRLLGATVSPLIARPVMPLNPTGVARLALRHRNEQDRR